MRASDWSQLATRYLHDHLVAVRVEILAHERAEGLFGRPRRRTVVVSQVEVRDAEIERAARDVAAVLEYIDVAEVVPEAERNGRQAHATAPHAVVLHRLVTRGGRLHEGLSSVSSAGA